MSTFGQINLLVTDMAASIAFYRLLELDVPDTFEWPTGSGAEHVDDILSNDSCYMALDNYAMARIWDSRFEPNRHHGNVVVGLIVDSRDDVDRLNETVRAPGYRPSSSTPTATRSVSRAPSMMTASTSPTSGVRRSAPTSHAQ
jgi:predicted lactoylglutathione lyase